MTRRPMIDHAFLMTLAVISIAWAGCRPQSPNATGKKQQDQASTDSRHQKSQLNASTDRDWRNAAQVEIKEWRHIADLPVELAQFDTVFWDAADSDSLRQWIRDHDLQGSEVLEIGTGSGLISLCCLQGGATRVVATDINPNALANALYNADRMEFEVSTDGDAVEDKPLLDLRWVDKQHPEAFTVIADDERFDFIISNPPWENQRPQTVAEHAFYDENFSLLESLLAGLDQHLKPNGRCLLAYGCVDAIRTTLRRAEHYHLNARILDDRSLDELPELFLPGMLIEVTRR